MNTSTTMTSGGSRAMRVRSGESHLMRFKSESHDEIAAAFDQWLTHTTPDDLTPPDFAAVVEGASEDEPELA